MDTNSKPRTVGVIDVGSNTIKLLIAKRGEDRRPSKVDFIVEETRIGEGLNRHPPMIDPDALRRGADAIARLVKAGADCEALAIVATSAVRDAANKTDFIDAVEKASGRRLRVLSGDEEADFIGKGLRCDPSLAHLQSFTVLDLGGGSLECIQFLEQCVLKGQSLQLGSVRLASLLLEDRARPLTSCDESEIREHVTRHWSDSQFAKDSSPSNSAIITGGTANILSDSVRPEQRRSGLDLSDFKTLVRSICSATESERVNDYNIPTFRADIFPTALVTIEASLEYLGCNRIYFSAFNLRYGVAAKLLARGSLD